MTPEKASKTRIVVIDDHPLVRERLIELIGREPDLEICGEAEDRSGALEVISATHPHIAIVDLSLKGSLGLELIKDLQVVRPDLLLLVVSMQEETVYGERCLRAGAKGYITKQQASRHIMQAIRTVLSGELYMSEELMRHLASRNLGSKTRSMAPPVDTLLSDRELQVFERIGMGASTRAIAEDLSLDVKTIETYRARIREKLGSKDSSELLHESMHLKQGEQGTRMGRSLGTDRHLERCSGSGKTR